MKKPLIWSNAIETRLIVPPKKEALPAYFFLFEGRNGTLNKVFTSRMHLRGNFEESMQIFKSTKPMFNSYEDFLDSIE